MPLDFPASPVEGEFKFIDGLRKYRFTNGGWMLHTNNQPTAEQAAIPVAKPLASATPPTLPSDNPFWQDTVSGILYFQKDTNGTFTWDKVSTDTPPSGLLNASITGVAATATKLATARFIDIEGDAAGFTTFDGTGDAVIDLVFSNTGISAGEHIVTTFDAKGRATASRSLVSTDIPSLPGSKITSALTVDTSGNAASATTAGKLTTAHTINGTQFDGTADITINAVDSTARIASSEKGVANGVATLDSTGVIPSNQLPSYVDDVLEYASLAAFPATGVAGKIYTDIATGDIYRWSGTVYINISNHAGTADAATKLATVRTVSLSGLVTGSVSFDGSANVTLATTVQAASTTQAGVVQLSDSIALVSSTTGASATAVKAAYDLAFAAATQAYVKAAVDDIIDPFLLMGV